jgi:eukaryotic-like serine/threonine-protein kinase
MARPGTHTVVAQAAACVIATMRHSSTNAWKGFARRHKALVIGIATVFVVLAAGVIASTWEAVRAEKRRADAEAATARAVTDDQPDPDLKVRTALDRAAARIVGKFNQQPKAKAHEWIVQLYLAWDKSEKAAA